MQRNQSTKIWTNIYKYRTQQIKGKRKETPWGKNTLGYLKNNWNMVDDFLRKTMQHILLSHGGVLRCIKVQDSCRKTSITRNIDTKHALRFHTAASGVAVQPSFDKYSPVSKGILWLRRARRGNRKQYNTKPLFSTKHP